MATAYRDIPRLPAFPELERTILELWRELDVFGQLRRLRADAPPWSFLDGPITANNPMGVHHAWGRSYKDMFQRYHAMNDRRLRYQNGFDCQGLWVEVEVEKELGFQTKADIVEHGLEHFVRRCKQRVLEFAARQTEQSIRLGYWMEWDDPEVLRTLSAALERGDEEVSVVVPSGRRVTDRPEAIIGRLGSPEYGGSYFTFSDENNYTIWSFLKKCHEQGYVYRGNDVMPWCCRCGTGLSQMEVAEGRKITHHTSVFVRFPLRGRDREALLVWTTTPWTLPANVAAAVNPAMQYVKLRHRGWTLYVGKENLTADRVQELEAGGQRLDQRLHTLHSMLKGSGDLTVLEELPGSRLVGLEYDGPFDHFEAQQRAGGVTPLGGADAPETRSIDCHRVVPWDEVSGTEGTGIVHIAPGCGAEDYRLGKELGLVGIAPLTESGHYLPGFGDLSGRHVGEVVGTITTDLRQRELLVAQESYPHVYPHCWRCKQELVFRLVTEWFIRMDWRDRIERIVPDIRWIPPDGEARERDWLRNMGDWMISKKRFWGLALPIWVCEDCDAFDVVGSHDELQDRAVAGWDEFSGHSPHRPHIDGVELTCGECGGVARRVEDVGNPWLDAGIVPYSTLRYNEQREYWAQWFPADFVVECFPGQFRNWFYALLAMSAMLEDRAPFRVLLGHALVRDAKGHEMHKSAGNAIAFDEAAEVFGAEIMRYLFASQNPVHNLNFPALGGTGASRKQQSIDGEVRAKLLTLWNCYGFFVTYAQVDAWTPPAEPTPVAARAQLDRWIISRLQRLVDAAHAAFGELALYRFIEQFEAFMDELSNWYLRRSRRRFWKDAGDPDKHVAYQTLHDVLVGIMRTLAPILPFLTEAMYQNIYRPVMAGAPDSVHLLDYPRADHALKDEALEHDMERLLHVKNLALALRNVAKVRARQPLARLIVQARDEHEHRVLSDEQFATHLREECNIKQIELRDSAEGLVTARLRPQYKTLGPRYGKQMKAIVAHLERVPVDEVQAALAAGGYAFDVDGVTVELTTNDVDVHLQGPPGFHVLPNGIGFVAIDTTMTPELAQEGLARDFNRQVQIQRKELDLRIDERIRVIYSAAAEVVEAVERHRDYLLDELLAVQIEAVPTLEGVTGKVGTHQISFLVARAVP